MTETFVKIIFRVLWKLNLSCNNLINILNRFQTLKFRVLEPAVFKKLDSGFSSGSGQVRSQDDVIAHRGM